MEQPHTAASCHTLQKSHAGSSAFHLPKQSHSPRMSLSQRPSHSGIAVLNSMCETSLNTCYEGSRGLLLCGKSYTVPPFTVLRPTVNNLFREIVTPRLESLSVVQQPAPSEGICGFSLLWHENRCCSKTASRTILFTILYKPCRKKAINMAFS